MLRYYIDLDTCQLRRRLSGYPLEELSAKLGAHLEFEVQFIRNCVPEAPAATNPPVLQVKPANEYDAGFYALQLISAPGSGTGVYTFSDIVDGVTLRAQLSPNLELAELPAEITWLPTTRVRAGVDDTRKTSGFLFRLENSVTRGGETADNYPETTSVNVLSAITRLTGGTETDLDAIPLAAYPAGALFDVTTTINSVPVKSRWKKTSGSGTTNTAAGIIRTLDYNPTTNPFVLVRVSGL